MVKKPFALLLKFPGTNCDRETARALELVGFEALTAPISAVSESSLEGVDLLVLPGGFSYGDYIMAGRLAELELTRRLGPALCRYRDRGGYILGICNGFQILCRLGFFPVGSLTENTSGRFICRWVTLENRNPRNPYLSFLPETFELPIAHSEGRFVTLQGLAQQHISRGLVPLTYRDDVNGSISGIAALSDETGRVFGLMPHPERFVFPEDHYSGTWRESPWGWGYYFFLSVRTWTESSRQFRIEKELVSQ